ncbi:hypothetical protein NP233_g248 [Leucocoprinus birnbaumii]|uniref:F-box domain-containing protein n=1 Tax=Leucocoprinus birnbaumii TaxID=56174 RepID=A0AAD5W5S4_9AGAR|nr:hypothetical protein NP233_g248 [Leucocoprinus birnbaumii]
MSHQPVDGDGSQFSLGTVTNVGPPIFQLPYDILDVIFKEVCWPSSSKLPSTQSLIRLGAVCRLWYQVTQSTSYLWTCIELTSGSCHENRIQALEKQIRNAGNCHFDVVLQNNPNLVSLQGHLHSSEHDRGFPSPNTFQLIFVRHANKIKSITFLHFYPPWLRGISHLSRLGRFSNLQSFKYSPSRYETLNNFKRWRQSDPALEILLHSTPRLQHMVISSSFQSNFIFPYSQITSLQLALIDIVYAIPVITQCSNVEICHIENLIQSFPGVFAPEAGLQKLPWRPHRLHTLSLIHRYDAQIPGELVNLLIQRTTFPSSIQVKFQCTSTLVNQRFIREFFRKNPRAVNVLDR